MMLSSRHHTSNLLQNLHRIPNNPCSCLDNPEWSVSPPNNNSTFLQDPKHGNWWLQFGSSTLVGYWPSFLFDHLNGHATMVQFGGEIVNTRPSSGGHTSTQMGSGHFSTEGFRKASYFRNLQVVDGDNSLMPPQDLRVLADHPSCYDIRGGTSGDWGIFFYYGGPGRNLRCP